MQNQVYAILGATGNTGSIIAENLLKQNKKVRVIGRDASKLEKFKKMGAEVFIAKYDDVNALTTAFKGATAAYTLVPPNFMADDFSKYQDQVGVAIATSIKNAGVKKVVNLSSIGADATSGSGPILGLHKQEKRLNEIGVDVMHLRPGYFIENMFGSFGTIRAAGVNGSVLKANLPMVMISTKDIGTFATQYLTDLNFTGSSYIDLAGPEEITQTKATQILGEAIGKPDLKYVEFPEDAVRQGMIGAGLKPQMADLYIEMMKGFNSGKLAPTQPFTAKNRGKVRVQDYAPAFKAAWNS